MRKAFVLGCILLFLPIITWASAERVIRAVTQSVKGTTITRVALRSIPYSDSLQMTIFTTSGERSLILSKKHIQVALKTLNNPRLLSSVNAVFSKRYINTHHNLNHYATTQSSTKILRPNAASIVPAHIMAANQQASR